MDRAKMAAWFKDRAENAPMPGAKAMYQATYDLLTRSQWISVKERLPEHRQKALCLCRANIYEVLVWDELREWVKSSDCEYMKRFVTHWMPLPEPPKEGAEE